MDPRKPLSLRQQESSFQRYKNPLNERQPQQNDQSQSSSFEKKVGPSEFQNSSIQAPVPVIVYNQTFYYPASQLQDLMQQPVFELKKSQDDLFQNQIKIKQSDTLKQEQQHAQFSQQQQQSNPSPINYSSGSFRQETPSFQKQDNLAAFIMNQSIQHQEDQKRGKEDRIQTVEGVRLLTEIDIALLSRYEKKKTQIFIPPNNRYQLKEVKMTNSEWLKDRLQHRYHQELQNMFLEIVEEVQKIRNLEHILSMQEPIKCNWNFLQKLENNKQSRNSQQVDTMKPLILELQKKIAIFIHSNF